MPTNPPSAPRPILVLHVGGTIGMRASPRGLAPLDDFPAVLAARLAPFAERLPSFVIEAFATPIDSAEAHPGDWTAIATHIAAGWSDFSGFVVLHGTDTMAFTAAALSFMLRDLDRPVIVTGAQRPVGAPGSDGLGNVVAALRFAARPPIREVCIAFDGLLLRGNRATKVSTSRLDGFGSPNFPALGRITDTVDGEAGFGPVEIDTAALLPPTETAPVVDIPGSRDGEVISLRLVPGFTPGLLDASLAVEPKGIILECYGAGTVPALDGRMADFLARAHARDIVVLALSQVAHGGLSLGAYAAGASLIETGVVDGGDMTFEAAFTKLGHLIGTGLPPQEIRDRLAVPIAGELTLR